MRKLVLLVDDDRLPMRFYVRAMEQTGFEVKHFFEPDSALAFMRKRGPAISMVILDIMMPPGKSYEKKSTNAGLKTGIFLLKDTIVILPGVPVLILTNVKNPDTIAEIRKVAPVEILQKMECPPFKLAQIVEEVLGKATDPGGIAKGED
jgi:DNA-binding NtrC family response regulator